MKFVAILFVLAVLGTQAEPQPGLLDGLLDDVGGIVDDAVGGVHKIAGGVLGGKYVIEYIVIIFTTSAIACFQCGLFGFSSE